MTNDQCSRTDALRCRCDVRASFRHSCFEFPSTFEIRASSFRRAKRLCLFLCTVAAAAGCRGTPIDVAKGRPTDGSPNFVASDYQPKQDDGLDWFSTEKITKSMKQAVGLGPDKKIAEAAFADGEKLFGTKEYDKAAKKFGTAVSRWPDSALEEDAMFLQAESYFFADRYSSAIDTYGELIKKYPNTRHLNVIGARQFAVARYWQDTDHAHHRWTLVPNVTDRTQPLFDTGGHAINTYDSVRVNDPRGPWADAAIIAQANIFFQDHRYEDADYYYNLIRTDYPKSRYLTDAYLLGLQCKLLKYQGPGYNGKPLEEADQLIDQMLVQFPTELGSERDRIVKAKAEVKAQRATRDIKLAQYWDNGKHYGAARIYYAKVLKDYPQTPFAEEAKTRLAAIQGEPNDPPNRLAFITDLFEKKDKDDQPDTPAEGTRKY
jgi:outer membrane protein assembly factor BamD (BamD/ComL family)